MAGYVFISYSRSDRDYVLRLVDHLRAQGISSWVDHEVAQGDRWVATIRDRIDGCNAMVVVMSPDAEQSSWVLRETAYAERLGKPVLPLLLRGGPAFFLADVQYENVEGARMPSAEFAARVQALMRPALAPLARYPYRRELRIGLVALLVPLALVSAVLFGWGGAELAYRQHWTMADAIELDRDVPLGFAYWLTAGLTVAAALAATALGLALARVLARPAIWAAVGMLAVGAVSGLSAREYTGNTAVLLVPVIVMAAAAMLPVDPTTRRRTRRRALLLGAIAVASCVGALSWTFLRIEYTGLGTQDLIELYREKAGLPLGPLLWTVTPPVTGTVLALLLMHRLEGLLPQIHAHRAPRTLPAWLFWRVTGLAALVAIVAVGVRQDLRRPDRWFTTPELSAVMQPWFDDLDRCTTTVCSGTLRPAGTYTLDIDTEADDAAAIGAMTSYLVEYRNSPPLHQAGEGITYATDDRNIVFTVRNCRCWITATADSPDSFEALWHDFDWGYGLDLD